MFAFRILAVARPESTRIPLAFGRPGGTARDRRNRAGRGNAQKLRESTSRRDRPVFLGWVVTEAYRGRYSRI